MVAFIANTVCVCIGNFYIVIWTKGIAGNDFIVRLDILFIKRQDGNASLLQTALSEIIFINITALNLMAHLVQHQSQSAHTRALNPDKMIGFRHDYSLRYKAIKASQKRKISADPHQPAGTFFLYKLLGTTKTPKKPDQSVSPSF